jgi:cation diffusion facilitator CzcD-associated flavoprotein CzcO
VRLAVRTAPHILRRSTLGFPAQATGILVRRLPTALVDKVGGVVGRLSIPDLSAQGLPRPTTGLYSQVRRGRIPIQDVGIVDAIRDGRVEVVRAVTALEGDTVVLEDGSRITPDVVVVATGYARGLEPLVGDLAPGLLGADGRPTVHGTQTHPDAPNLWFLGFTNPISGMFRELAIDARRIGRAIAVCRSYPAFARPAARWTARRDVSPRCDAACRRRSRGRAAARSGEPRCRWLG